MGERIAIGNDPLEENTRIMQEFYKPSQTSKQVNLKTGGPKYIRQTYHLRKDQIKKIKAYAFYNEIHISEVVRQAMDEFFSTHPVNV